MMLYGRYLVYKYILLLLPTFKYCSINMNQVDYMANELSNHISYQFEIYTRASILEAEFNRLYDEKHFKVIEKNVSDISKTFSKNLYDLLESNKQSLTNIKNKIEDLHNNYEYNDSITAFPYDNERDISEDSVVEAPSFYPRIKVNMNQSNVQIPMNIYKNDKSILNAVKWSLDVNKVFKSNHEKTPSLLWQYFASKEGVMRTYPGRRDSSEANFYDARRRLWYTEAINSPKDVIIAVDLSGSLIGTPFKIASLTVKSLINTFQQNDFFNVIYSRDKKISYVQPCLKRLFQATDQHKELINERIDLIAEPLGEQNNTGLLREAFQIFNKSIGNDRTSSGCTKTLMIISDGIESDTEYDDIVHEYFKDLDIVIFTFFIGFGTCKGQMRELAQSNGGEMYEFPTVGSVWNGVLVHQTVLSEPLAESLPSNNITFTPLYLDFAEDGQIGLGMIISMAIGVFSKDQTNRQLLGAAGIDIRMTQLEQQYPKDMLGVFGRGFAINNNGLFLIHPNFRDPHDPKIFILPTVYLEDIEYTENKSFALNLKHKMVERETGCLSSDKYFLFPLKSNKRFVKFHTAYCYQPIVGTPFTSAISIPDGSRNCIQVPNDQLNSDGINGLKSSQENIKIEIASWNFCEIEADEQKNKPVSKKYFPKAFELYKYLVSNTTDVHKICKRNKLFNLLLSSAIISNHTNEYWSKTMISNISKLYIFTASGYITMLTNNISETPNRDIFAQQEYMHPSAHLDQLNNEFITVTVPVKTLKGRLMKHSEINDSKEIVKLSFGKSITITPFNVKHGIIGLSYESSKLNERLVGVSLDFICSKPLNCTNSNNSQLTNKAESVNCSQSGNGTTFSCTDSENISCYIIDENAYVVSSNQEVNDIGVFFGLVKGKLLKTLVDKNLYKIYNFNDTQSICSEIVKTQTSNANHLKTFYVNLLTSFQFLVIKFISILVFTTNFIFGQEEENLAQKKINTICTQNLTIYNQAQQNIKFNGEMHCTKFCSQNFAIQSIRNTNLNLVIIENKCDSICEHFMVSTDPVRIETDYLCNKQNENSRKKLQVCRKKTSESRMSSASKNLGAMWKMTVLWFLHFNAYVVYET